MKPGWYPTPDGDGARWWDGGAWTGGTTPATVARIRLRRTQLLAAAAVFFLVGTVFMGPQAFGLSMVNFDEHVVDAHAAALGLLSGAAVALVLLIGGLVTHLRPRSPRHWTASTCCLLGVIGVEILSIAGFTEHVGLLLFS